MKVFKELEDEINEISIFFSEAIFLLYKLTRQNMPRSAGISIFFSEAIFLLFGMILKQDYLKIRFQSSFLKLYSCYRKCQNKI